MRLATRYKIQNSLAKFWCRFHSAANYIAPRKVSQMAVTELAFGSLVASNSFVTGDHTKRSAWQNSFFMPAASNDQYVLFCGPGGVTVGSSTVTYGPPGAGALLGILAGGQFGGIATGVQQVYIDSSGNAQCVQASSTSVSFPAGSLSLCFLRVDEVGRIQQIIDQRTSYLSSAPNLGSGMTEAIATPTLRAGFIANYYVPRTFSLTPQIPFDLALSASGFTLGGGSVNVPGIGVVTSSSIYFAAGTNTVANPPIGWRALAVNQINQGYVDPTSGAVTVRQVQTSGTFPANSLALFECTTDVVGLIRGLVDWRPSYI